MRQLYGENYVEPDVGGDINYNSPINHHYHYQQQIAPPALPEPQAQPAPVPPQPPAPQVTTSPGRLRWLAPLLLASGLGGGLAGAGWLIAGAIKARPVVTTQPEEPHTDTDTDTNFELRLMD